MLVIFLDHVSVHYHLSYLDYYIVRATVLKHALKHMSIELNTGYLCYLINNNNSFYLMNYNYRN